MKQKVGDHALVGAAWAAALCPLAITYAVLLRFSRNMPIFDDYKAILGFAVVLRAQTGVPSKLAYIVAAQFSEYKLIFEHLLVALDLAATGKVNFLLLCWLGNLTLLGTLAVFWKGLFPNVHGRNTRLALMVPVCWLLFELNYGENLDWAMCGLQSLTVLLFSAASLYLLARRELRLFIAACILGLLAVFSSANGLALAPAGLPMLLRTGSSRRLAAWLATFALGLGAYLFHYSPMHYPPLHLSLLDRATVYVSLLGGAIENRQHKPFYDASVLLGLALLTVSVPVLGRRFGKHNPFAQGLWIWILLSALPIAAVRAEPTLTSQLTGRYKLYSDLLLLLTFVYFTRHITEGKHLRQRPKLALACLAVIILFSLSSDLAGAHFLARRLHETESIALHETMPSDARAAFDEARRQGIYTLPPLPQP